MLFESLINEIISNLLLNEILILSVLYDNECDEPHKGMWKNDLMQRTKLSESNFRKAIHGLKTVRFITSVTAHKEYNYYITPYGRYAIIKKLEKEV